MPSTDKPVVKILDSDIRVHNETGFICITDIGNLKGQVDKLHVANWLQATTPIVLFHSWEK